MDYVYGYVIKNVIPAAPSRRSPEVQEFIDFMARVFGEPNAHHAHKCGAASLRSALWWTNTFTQHYNKAVQHEFERPPRETYAQIVERCSGIVEVVGIDPPQYRPSSAVMREACLLDKDYAGFYTRQELGFSKEEMVIAIGNVFEDHSVKSQELRAAQHELRRSTAAAVEAEMEHAINMATLKQGTRVKPPDNPRTSARVTKAGRRWLEEQRQATRATEREIAKARRRVLAADHTARVVAGDHKAAKPRPRRGRAATGRKTVSAALTLLMWLALLGPACFVAAGVGSRAGAGLMADVFGGAQERPAWATSHVNGADDKVAADGWSRRSRAALVKCYAAYANEKHLGKQSPTVKVTSKLINPKDSKHPHHWAISEDWKDKEGFATLMDSDPEWYAWGLDDLRSVEAEPYDFQLVDYSPVFKRQYHLAHREQEWANDRVKKLEKAGIVGEIESPYAAPVIVAPKKDEHGAWTDLRYAVGYRGLNERTIRDQYPCPTADELMTRMEGASRFTATDCTKAFHQRRVSDKPSGPDGLSAQQRLAFHAGNRLLTFKRMPFGHKNCVAAWQRVVDQALAGLDFAGAFADDVLIFSHDDEQEHMRRVRIVFDRLKARGVQVSPPKTRLGLSRVTFLGHIVSGAGVEPMVDKVEAINSLPAPKNVSDVRHFLGMATYCRFLESFSLVKAPLTALTKKDAP
eukprot:jgi/Tetstr1/455846/TSEL_042636.t1